MQRICFDPTPVRFAKIQSLHVSKMPNYMRIHFNDCLIPTKNIKLRRAVAQGHKRATVNVNGAKQSVLTLSSQVRTAYPALCRNQTLCYSHKGRIVNIRVFRCIIDQLQLVRTDRPLLTSITTWYSKSRPSFTVLETFIL